MEISDKITIAFEACTGKKNMIWLPAHKPLNKSHQSISECFLSQCKQVHIRNLSKNFHNLNGKSRTHHPLRSPPKHPLKLQLFCRINGINAIWLHYAVTWQSPCFDLHYIASPCRASPRLAPPRHATYRIESHNFEKRGKNFPIYFKHSKRNSYIDFLMLECVQCTARLGAVRFDRGSFNVYRWYWLNKCLLRMGKHTINCNFSLDVTSGW